MPIGGEVRENCGQPPEENMFSTFVNILLYLGKSAELGCIIWFQVFWAS